MTIFLLNPEKEFFIRELTRELSEQINSIRRELDNLRALGLLKTRQKNRKKYFYINSSFYLYNELKAMITKGMSNKDDIVRKISALGNVDVLVLSGLFINKDSLIDLLIVGDINKDRLEQYLSTDLETSRPIRFSILTRDDYLYRLKCHDKFLTDLINDPETLVAINNLESSLSKN